MHPRVILLLLCCVSFAAAAADETSAEPAQTAKVTYLTGSSIYVDAGTDQGLAEGDRLKLILDGESVAALQVTVVSSTRASCVLLDPAVAIEVGDVVQLPVFSTIVVHAEPRTSGPTTTAASDARTPSTNRETGRGRSRIRGRIGLRYLLVQDLGPGGTEFSQPALDFKLTGVGLATGHLDVLVDLRTRQTYRTMSNGGSESEDRTRAYRLALSLHDPRGRKRVTVGRQFSPSLASVSVFDGVMADFTQPRFSAGLFSGTQPDPTDFGLSDEIREHGGYVQFRNADQSPRRWSLTTGLVGSYVDGTVNREFAYLQGFYSGQRLSIYLAEEIDYNRDWKVEAGESTIEPTSTFFNIRYRLHRNFDLRGGFDNRRNVRLYRDHETPETEFDDSFREGVWLGGSIRFKQDYRVGFDAKTRAGGSSGSADTYNVSFRASRVSRLKLGLGYRGTRYANDRTEGWLHSLSTSLPIGSRIQLSVSGGTRDDRNLIDAEFDETMTWYGLDLDVSMGRNWFVAVSLEKNDGDLDNNQQLYLSTIYRF